MILYTRNVVKYKSGITTIIRMCLKVNRKNYMLDFKMYRF